MNASRLLPPSPAAQVRIPVMDTISRPLSRSGRSWVFLGATRRIRSISLTISVLQQRAHRRPLKYALLRLFPRFSPRHTPLTHPPRPYRTSKLGARPTKAKVSCCDRSRWSRDNRDRERSVCRSALRRALCQQAYLCLLNLYKQCADKIAHQGVLDWTLCK